MNRVFLRATVVSFFLCLSGSLAFGASNRTWVSGTGTDSGTCPRTAACATFAYALGQTNAGGEIDVLDPGDWRIPLLPSRYQLPKAELAEKWLYVERAIRQAYRAKPHQKALPFEITKRYLKQIQSQSQVDMVLAEQAKLTLSKQLQRVSHLSPHVKPDTPTDGRDKIMKAKM
jgi:hypothetical protein